VPPTPRETSRSYDYDAAVRVALGGHTHDAARKCDKPCSAKSIALQPEGVFDVSSLFLSNSSSQSPSPLPKKGGASRRNRPSLQRKVAAIKKYDELKKCGVGKTAEKLRVEAGAECREIPKNLERWLRKRHTIEAAAAENPVALNAAGKHKGGRGKKKRARARRVGEVRGAKYPQEERTVLAWIQSLRSQGLRVKARMVRAHMRVEVEDSRPLVVGPRYRPFKASSGWLKRFMKRHRLCWRRRNNNKSKSVKELLPRVLRFISYLRRVRRQEKRAQEEEIEDDGIDECDESCRKWGQFCPHTTFNVDQVPMPFANDDEITMDFVGTRRVWIKQLGSGLEKRQCTLQLCIRALGEQPKPTLLFRGNTELVRDFDAVCREEEEQEYDKDVVVLW
jgi:hypothetical protein